MLEGTHVEILQNRIEDSAEAIKSAGQWERNGGYLVLRTLMEKSGGVIERPLRETQEERKQR